MNESIKKKSHWPQTIETESCDLIQKHHHYNIRYKPKLKSKHACLLPQQLIIISQHPSFSICPSLWFLMSGFRCVCVWLCPLPVLSCSNGGDAAYTLCLKPWGFSGVSAISCCKVALLVKQICKFLLNFCCFSCLDTCLRCCSMFYNNVLYIYINVRDICVSVCLLSRTVDLYKGLFVSERRKTVRASEI